MNPTTRRTFIIHAVAGSSALGATLAVAQAGPKLEETDAQAVALSYKHDASKVDAKKFPNRAATDNCANCQLYLGKPNEATGGCPLFGAKQVAAAGWCSAWAKKTA